MISIISLIMLQIVLAAMTIITVKTHTCRAILNSNDTIYNIFTSEFSNSDTIYNKFTKKLSKVVIN